MFFIDLSLSFRFTHFFALFLALAHAFIAHAFMLAFVLRGLNG